MKRSLKQGKGSRLSKPINSYSAEEQYSFTSSSKDTNNFMQSSLTVNTLTESPYRYDRPRVSSSRNTESMSETATPLNFDKQKVKLIPVKYKDYVNMIKVNFPEYKEPVLLNLKENDIDDIIKIQTESPSRLKSQGFGYTKKVTPVTSEEKQGRKKIQVENQIPPTLKTSEYKELNKYPYKVMENTPVYAMNNTDIHTLPVKIGQRGFHAPQKEKPPKKIKPQRFKRRDEILVQPRYIHHSRDRSKRRRSRPKRVRVKRPVVVVRRKIPYNTDHDIPCCTTYPMCENTCIDRKRYAQMPASVVSTPHVVQPKYVTSKRALRTKHVAPSRTIIRYVEPPRTEMKYTVPSRTVLRRPVKDIGECDDTLCSCYACMEKLKFIQPGVCGPRKCLWTNEYAIIPKPQIHLIDPCEDMDPVIYPRANNPCIRDGRGNPLTDCIGRPLRDPVGKKFLSFTANGSVMDTNIKGKFYTGQPPLCVKCEFPQKSCHPDTTHNSWLGCGYPIQPNMDPFYKKVLQEHHYLNRLRL